MDDADDIILVGNHQCAVASDFLDGLSCQLDFFCANIVDLLLAARNYHSRNAGWTRNNDKYANQIAQ